MDSNIISAFIGAVVGFSAGVIKPLVDWNIEKKRVLREDRKAFIAECRSVLTSSMNMDVFIHTSTYARLRPFLDEKIIRDLEVNTHIIEIVSDHKRYGNSITLLKYVDSLEKLWKLI